MSLRPERERLRRRAQAGLQRRLDLANLHHQVEELDHSCPSSDFSESVESESVDGEESADCEENDSGGCDSSSVSDSASDVENNGSGADPEEVQDLDASDNEAHVPVQDERQAPVYEEVPYAAAAPVNDAQPNEEELRESLQDWALRRVSFKKVDKLLKILLPYHPTLPRNYKALLETPRRNPTEAQGVGEYWYRGIAVNLRQRLTLDYLQIHNCIAVDINIDGLSPFGSVPYEMWPILCCLVDHKEPFIIAVYAGPVAPQDVNLFLGDFVREVRNLLQNGFTIFGNTYPFEIRDYILDAPARAKIKCIIGHNGTYSCEKCEVRGRKISNCMVYEDFNAPRRTDLSFTQRSTPLHHSGESPLEAIGTGMVSQFRLDSMHLVHLGCSKRWLEFVMGTRKRRGIATAPTVEVVERRRAAIANHIPCDFVRRSRSLRLRGRYKATELRRLMLYDGLVIFKQLPRALWRNYLIYFSSIYIMSSPTLVRTKLEAAEILVPHFLQHSRRHLGRHFTVYNVHSLLHLIEECRRRGHLELFSAFKFETYLGIIKSYLRSKNKPLTQLKNRCQETGGHLLNPVEQEEADITLCQKIPLQEGFEEGQDYKTMKLHNLSTRLKVSQPDSCFETRDGSVVQLTNIRHMANGTVLLWGHKFITKEDYFRFPLPSSELGIWQVSNPDPVKRQWNILDFFRKCVLLPCLDENDVFVSIPLLHVGEQQL